MNESSSNPTIYINSVVGVDRILMLQEIYDEPVSLIQLPPVKLSRTTEAPKPNRFSILKKEYQKDLERFMKKPVEYLEKQEILNNQH